MVLSAMVMSHTAYSPLRPLPQPLYTELPTRKSVEQDSNLHCWPLKGFGLCHWAIHA